MADDPVVEGDAPVVEPVETTTGGPGAPVVEPVETTARTDPARSDDQVLADLDFEASNIDAMAASAAAAAQAADTGGAADNPELTAARAEAASLLDQLQRERASFTNYRNRTQRDLDTAKQRGMEQVLEAMLPVLDSIDRAQAAGELSGSMQAIAEQIDGTLAKFGIERYGEVGEVFDPNIHNAMMHTAAEGDDADGEAKVNLLIDHGYKIGEKVVRAANVGVVGPQ